MSKKIKVEIERAEESASILVTYNQKETAQQYYYAVVYLICCINMIMSVGEEKTLIDSIVEEEKQIDCKVKPGNNADIVDTIIDCITDLAASRDYIEVAIRKE